jgi:molybdopterin synthase sulfur carrier subunit
VIKIKIHIILELKKIIGQREIEVTIPEESTVESLLSWMAKTYGEKLSSNLFVAGSLNPLPHIALMVNGRSIRFLNGIETVLHNGDEILILPPVAGG